MKLSALISRFSHASFRPPSLTILFHWFCRKIWNPDTAEQMVPVVTHARSHAYLDNDRIHIGGGDVGGKEYGCRHGGGDNIKHPHCVCEGTS